MWWREKDHIDNGQIEVLIQRAAHALCYETPDKVLERLVSKGAKTEAAYNAVIAGSILLKGRDFPLTK
jgi:hypothetical protein